MPNKEGKPMLATITDHQVSLSREAVVDWINHILDRKDWNGTELAKKANLAPSTVLRLLNNPDHKFTPSLRTLQKIASASNYPIPRSITEILGATMMEKVQVDEAHEEAHEDLRQEAFAESEAEQLMNVGGGDNPHRTSRVAKVNRQRGTVPSVREREPAREPLELKNVTTLPASFHPRTRSEYFVDRPEFLVGDETAFAFKMPGSIFEPMIRANEILYATRSRDPIPGDLVLITDQTGRSKVRLLVEANEEGFVLSSTVPLKPEVTVPFEEVSEFGIVCAYIRV